MERAGEASVDEGLSGELVDVTALDIEEVLAADDTPLMACVRRLIELNSRPGSAVAGFESALAED